MATKTAAKTAPANKLATATQTKPSGDLITQVAKEVEALTEAQAYKMAESLQAEGVTNAFRLGGVLARIQDAGWLGGHDDFKTLCEDRFGISYRTAAYTITIYENLVAIGVKWSQVAHLGWTKLRVLATVMTVKNHEGWIAKAEKMSVIQLTEAVKKAKAKSAEANAEEGGTSTITTLTLKLHEDQKKVVTKALEKAKKEVKTEFDSVALTNVMTAYMGGSVEMNISGEKLPEEPAEFQALLMAVIKKAGYEAALTAVEKTYPKLKIAVEVPKSMRKE